MPLLHAAISVSDTIETYGAYAGLAAVVGLGVLSMLYFAQAREVKRLREWAGASDEREAVLARKVITQASRAAAAARPMGAQTAAGKAAPGARVGGPATIAAASAVAKVANPPTGQHTAVIPAAAGTPAAAAPAPTDGAPVPSPGVPATGEAGDTGAATPPAAPNGQPPMAAPPGIPPKPGVPLTVPAVAAAAAAAADDAGETGDTGPLSPPVRATGPRPLRAGATSTAASPTPSTLREAEKAKGGRRSAGRIVAIVAGVALAVAALGGGAVALLGGDDPQTPENTVQRANPDVDAGDTGSGDGSTSTSTQTADPASVNVSVLNGTGVTGLAAQIAETLKAEGYTIGTTANASDQSRSATVIGFTEGSRAEALKIGKRIGVGEDAVKALDQSSAVLAGEDADVVVTVGADRTDLP